MFTFSFCILLALSVAALKSALRNLTRPLDLSRFRLGMGTYAYYFVIATLAVLLDTRSRFSGRYVVLGFMILSFLVDYWYNYRLDEANRASEPAPRRGWWPVFDNAAWVAIVVLLYVA